MSSGSNSTVTHFSQDVVDLVVHFLPKLLLSDSSSHRIQLGLENCSNGGSFLIKPVQVVLIHTHVVHSLESCHPSVAQFVHSFPRDSVLLRGGEAVDGSSVVGGMVGVQIVAHLLYQ